MAPRKKDPATKTLIQTKTPAEKPSEKEASATPPKQTPATKSSTITTELPIIRHELEASLATYLMWSMAKAQIRESKLKDDSIFEEEWNRVMNVETIKVRQDREQQAVQGSGCGHVGQASETGKTTSTTRGQEPDNTTMEMEEEAAAAPPEEEHTTSSPPPPKKTKLTPPQTAGVVNSKHPLLILFYFNFVLSCL